MFGKSAVSPLLSICYSFFLVLVFKHIVLVKNKKKTLNKTIFILRPFSNQWLGFSTERRLILFYRSLGKLVTLWSNFSSNPFGDQAGWDGGNIIVLLIEGHPRCDAELLSLSNHFRCFGATWISIAVCWYCSYLQSLKWIRQKKNKNKNTHNSVLYWQCHSLNVERYIFNTVGKWHN